MVPRHLRLSVSRLCPTSAVPGATTFRFRRSCQYSVFDPWQHEVRSQPAQENRPQYIEYTYSNQAATASKNTYVVWPCNSSGTALTNQKVKYVPLLLTDATGVRQVLNF